MGKLPEYNIKGKRLPDIADQDKHTYSNSLLPDPGVVKDTISHCQNCGGDLRASIRLCCQKYKRGREAIRFRVSQEYVPSFWERIAEQNQRKRELAE
jgi:hypothetical protein